MKPNHVFSIDQDLLSLYLNQNNNSGGATFSAGSSYHNNEEEPDFRFGSPYGMQPQSVPPPYGYMGPQSLLVDEVIGGTPLNPGQAP